MFFIQTMERHRLFMESVSSIPPIYDDGVKVGRLERHLEFREVCIYI